MRIPNLTWVVGLGRITNGLIGYGRNGSAEGVLSSGIVCNLCHQACDSLPKFLQGPCHAACDATACKIG